MKKSFVTLALLVVAATSATAATFTVTTNADSGAGSLRDAVAQANATPGGNTIAFSVFGTIVLTSGQIAITAGPLTIVGPGAANLAIDGNANDRIFMISEPDAPACPAPTGPNDFLVTISGLTVQNGIRNLDSSGGGIFSAKSLTLDSVVIRNNVAPRAAGVAFNTQYNGQTLTVVNSHFLNNTARPTANGTANNVIGGGLRVVNNCDGTRQATTTTISGSVFSGNRLQPTTTSSGGAGIALFSFGTVTISDTRIFDNHVEPLSPLPGRFYLGGGIEGYAKSLTIERTEIAENSAGSAGGVYLFNDFADQQGDGSAWRLRLVNTTVANNAALFTGGGLLISGNIAVEIYNSTISGNLAQAQAVAGVHITTQPTNPATSNNATPPILKLVSSIISNTTVSAADVGISLGGIIPTPFIVDATNSLVQTPGLGIQGDRISNLIGVSPYLGPLAFNGGPTRTLLPKPASLVIDRGANPLGLASDQRGTGFVRVQNTVADIGAVESESNFKPSAGFTPPVSYYASNPFLRVATDLTGDSLTDLASVDTIGGTADVLINNGDGTFAPRSYAVGNQPAMVVPCDLNGDNLRDLVIPSKGSDSLSILMNRADGTFVAASNVPTGSQPVWVNCQAALSTAPVRHQIHAINGGDNTFQQFSDDAAGAFSLKATVPIGSDPRVVATSDLNFDLLWDAVTFNYGSSSVTVLKQGPAFQFTSAEYAVGAGPTTGGLTDVTSDSLLDIISVNSTGNSVSILANVGGATFQPAVHYSVGLNPTGHVVGDFNGDGYVDIAVRNAGSNDVAVLVNNADGTFKPAVFYPVGGAPSTIGVADFDGDAVLDLVVGVASPSGVAVLYGRGDGTFRPAVFAALPSAPGTSVQTADVNGDGRPDITVPLTGENQIAVLLNTTQQAILAPLTKPNYQGLWWRLPAGSESGWGVNLAHQRDTIFITWFTYGQDGKPLWLAAVLQKVATNVYAGDVFTTTGPAFDAVPFDPGQVTESVVGTVTLTFFLSGNAYFAYTVDGIAQSKYITRQLFAEPVPVCVWGAQDNLAFATNYQDLWWRFPAGSESGWGVNLTQQGNLIVATWFTYRADGKPMWYIAVAENTGATTFAGPISSVTGPPFDAVPFDPANVVETVVGNVAFTFVDGNRGTFAYTVNGVSQVKEITRQVFEPPGTVCF